MVKVYIRRLKEWFTKYKEDGFEMNKPSSFIVWLKVKTHSWQWY
jgi:hypothetical protein